MLRASGLFGRVGCLILLAHVAAAATAAPQDRDPKIDSLAKHLAQKLHRWNSVKGGRGEPVSFLVFDFAVSNKQATLLGVHLADEFSSALSSESQGFTPIDRTMIRDLISRDGLQAADLQSDAAASWAAKAVGARLAIVGTIEPMDGEFNLHVRVIDEYSEEIADAGEHLEWTEQRRSWDTHVSTVPFSRVGSPVSRAGVYHPGRDGVGDPICVRCPNPSYTEDARAAKYSGSAVFQIVINPDGSVEDAVPVRGLPYGLTRQALASIRTWQFKPVIGPDGRPVPVQLDVEVTFRIQ